MGIANDVMSRIDKFWDSSQKRIESEFAKIDAEIKKELGEVDDDLKKELGEMSDEIDTSMHWHKRRVIKIIDGVEKG